MSFRRQMHIKQEDISKLPSSLLINLNYNQFRIFLTNDTLICFLCKTTGHTSINCKKYLEMKSVSEPIINTDITTTQNNAFEEQPEPIDDQQTTLEPMIDQIQEQTTLSIVL